MKRKVLSLLLTAVMVLGLLPAAALAAFPDTEGHWAADAIQRWSDAGIVTGGSDGNFNPDAPVTRAELATILCRLFAYDSDPQKTYEDVPADAWYAGAMSACAAAARWGPRGPRPRRARRPRSSKR